MDTAEVWPAQLCMCAVVSGRGGGVRGLHEARGQGCVVGVVEGV